LQWLTLSVLFQHSAKSLILFDAFRKSIFHFLVLPRVTESSLTVSELASLKSLLKCDKDKAKKVILDLREDAAALKQDIETEMMQRYGFKWGIWTGFHAAPSMKHLHLHVLSADLCSEKMKIKKHYNSFHPKLGFFLDIDEVLSWFDADPGFFSSMAKLKASEYEPILKEDLSCFRCHSHQKNMPTLKAHLQEDWNKLEKQATKHTKNENVTSEADCDGV